MRLAMYTLYKHAAEERDTPGRHATILKEWRSLKGESVVFDPSLPENPALGSAVALANTIIWEDISLRNGFPFEDGLLGWQSLRRYLRVNRQRFDPESVYYTITPKPARRIDEHKQRKLDKQAAKAARTAERMAKRRPGKPTPGGWIPVAGRDMPDVETNPGPVTPIIPVVDVRGGTTGVEIDPTANNQYYGRPLLPTYNEMLVPQYHHDSYYGANIFSKCFAAVCHTISECLDCGYTAKSAKSAEINYGNSNVVLPSTGKWRLEPFLIDTLHDPVDVILGENQGYISRVTGVYTPWPCHARPTGRRTTAYTYRVRERTLEVGVWSPVPMEEWALYSNLRHMDHPTLPNETIMTWSSDGTTFIKFASEHGYVTIPTSILADLYSLYAQSTHVSANSVATRLEMNGMPRTHADQLAPKMMALLGGKKGSRNLDYFTMPTYNNQVAEALDDENFNADYGTQEGPSLLEDPAALPSMSRDNDRAAVHYRINMVNPGNVQEPPHITARIIEFASVFRPPATIGRITREEVIARQNTAITRHRMTTANEEPAQLGAKVSAFVKKEAYTEPKDTRNISAINPEHNLWGFQYMIPIKEHLKTLSWYGPGKGPAEVVTQLNDMMCVRPPNGFEHVNSANGPCFYEGDYSRFDGTQTETSRRISFRIMREWLDPSIHDDFDQMINAHFNSVCFLPDGTRYLHRGSMLSGSWATTDGNTILNAFCVFTALRDFGLSAAAASKHIGQCFGDDGLLRQIKRSNDGALFANTWIAATQQLGLRLEVIPRENKAGYLSRWYEFGFDGVQASVPDLGRLLPKFQYATSPDADLEYFKTKYSSLTILCGDTTPVLSAYLNKWFSLRNINKADVQDIIESKVDLPYWITLLDELNLVNTMFMPCTPSLAEFCLAEAAGSLGTDVETLLRAQTLIEQCSSIDELYDISIDRIRAGVPKKFEMVGDKTRVTGAPVETQLVRNRRRRV